MSDANTVSDAQTETLISDPPAVAEPTSEPAPEPAAEPSPPAEAAAPAAAAESIGEAVEEQAAEEASPPVEVKAEEAAPEPAEDVAAETKGEEAAPESADEGAPAVAEETVAAAASGEEPAAEAAAAEAGEGGDEAQGEAEDSKPPEVLSDEMKALYRAMETKTAIEGLVIGWNKGGYHVALGRIAAFCPVSHMEIGSPRSPKRYVDKSFFFHVIEIQKGGRRVVLSRASALQAEKEARAAEVRARLKPGTEVEGKVSSITDFGAFVDLGGGIEGLVHVSEISRKRIEHPKERVQIGQEVRVVVLKIEKGGERISLSMKRLEDDPWKGVSQRLNPVEQVRGTILRKTDFGLFVEVEPGLEGLVHTSRLPLGAGLDDESLEIGQQIDVWIHEVEGKRRRLSLSMRPVAGANPWKGVEDRFSEGHVVQGTVERLANFGVFIELEPGITGLLPFSELSMPSGANPRRQFHPGKEVSVRVLAVDRERRRISLGTEASKAMGSQVDYREYQKSQRKSSSGLNAMAAAFEKLRKQDGEAGDSP